MCSSCGTANQPGQKFCGECGTSLAASDAEERASATNEPAAEAPAAERRLVSVLFVDLVGFTKLSETRDAEEVRELLSRYFNTCRRLIELYGGTVEKFIGDAVMAVWGTPTATEDDAERAVRAALDLVTAVSALGDEVGATELRARAGVLTGEAAVTLGGEAEGMVAGDIVNSASRVQSVAEPGSVYVGESTRRATESTVVFEDAGSFELKGKAGQTPLWKALRVVSGVRGSRKSQGLEAPFVGRDRELRQIKDLFHASAEEKKAHLVAVNGIAGIGKSRLAWEFYKYFDGIAETINWHSGRCLAYGEGVTYWALADMVRMRCRIAEDEDAELATAKLQATLDEYVLQADERRFVEPRVAQLLGLGGQEFAERQELFAAWRLLFERIADEYPTVLLFEDMQWADASLLDFVEYLLEWSRSSPLFVVALARPELAERRPTWGAGLRNFSSVYLEPLSEAAMEELLAGLVPGLPGPLGEQILARAEGVPLYAVETVRMLLDRGALVPDGPFYRPAGEIQSLEVPETLHALSAARLDGLTGEERRLVQDGAVLGKTFTRSALATLSGLGDAELEPLLSSLVRKEVLGVQADPRSPEHGQYGFLQDLLRRVAYETLSKRERRTRHLAAAAQLAASFGEDEIAEVVAFHLVEAYRIAPDAEDAAELRQRARDALARAGERAASVAAGAEAQRYFEEAAELADGPADQAPLIDRAGQMASRASRPVEARALLERAHAAYQEAGQGRLAARVSAHLAEIDFFEGHLHTAVERMEHALAALQAGPTDAHVAVVAERLGRVLVLSGDGERAAPYVEQGLELAAKLDLSETLSHALSTRGIYLLTRDRYMEASAVLEAALALSVEHGHHAASHRAFVDLAEAIDCSDRYADSYELRLRGRDHARLSGDRIAEGVLIGESAIALYVLGRWDEALASVAEAETLTTLSYALIGMSTGVAIRCARGELETAGAELARIATVGESEDPQAVAAYGTAEGRVLLAQGKPAEALAAAERAIAAREQLGVAYWAVKAAFGVALEASFGLGDGPKVREHLATLRALEPGVRTPLLRAQHARFSARLDPVGCGAGFDEAEQILRALNAPFYLAATLLEHGESLVEQGRSDVAGALLAEARETFKRLGAIPWLERTARATSKEPRAEVAS
jgi:class 3 adenylate cyclase/tetratricopeptide (TPR) repeat protein